MSLVETIPTKLLHQDSEVPVIPVAAREFLDCQVGAIFMSQGGFWKLIIAAAAWIEN